MAASDPVEETIPVFTEGEVFLIGGYLHGAWDQELSDEELVEDIEAAIRAALNYGR